MHFSVLCVKQGEVNETLQIQLLRLLHCLVNGRLWLFLILPSHNFLAEMDCLGVFSGSNLFINLSNCVAYTQTLSLPLSRTLKFPLAVSLLPGTAIIINPTYQPDIQLKRIML